MKLSVARISLSRTVAVQPCTTHKYGCICSVYTYNKLLFIFAQVIYYFFHIFCTFYTAKTPLFARLRRLRFYKALQLLRLKGAFSGVKIEAFLYLL